MKKCLVGAARGFVPGPTGGLGPRLNHHEPYTLIQAQARTHACARTYVQSVLYIITATIMQSYTCLDANG